MDFALRFMLNIESVALYILAIDPVSYFFALLHWCQKFS